MHLTRFLRAAAGTALVLSIAAVPLAGRAEDPIEIDALLSLTGGIACVGKEAATGLAVAQDAINKAGGVNGRPERIGKLTLRLGGPILESRCGTGGSSSPCATADR